jgi:hypothetical protein
VLIEIEGVDAEKAAGFAVLLAAVGEEVAAGGAGEGGDVAAVEDLAAGVLLPGTERMIGVGDAGPVALAVGAVRRAVGAAKKRT